MFYYININIETSLWFTNDKIVELEPDLSIPKENWDTEHRIKNPEIRISEDTKNGLTCLDCR